MKGDWLFCKKIELRFSLVFSHSQSEAAVTLVSQNTPCFSRKNFNAYYLKNCRAEFLQNLCRYSVFLTVTSHMALLVEHRADTAEILILRCFRPLRSLHYARFKVGSWMNWHYSKSFSLKLKGLCKIRRKKVIIICIVIILYILWNYDV